MPTTLLIVDDEPAVRRGLRAVFESVGFAVLEAADAAAAEQAFGTHAIDLALIDLSLDGARGREGLDVVARACARGVTAPLVIFTSFGTPAVHDAAWACGAIDLWSKGLPIEEIVRRVIELAGPATAPA